MKRTTTIVKALAFTLSIAFAPASLLHAQDQNKNKTEISVQDLPKISVTSSMGNFHANFSRQNITTSFLTDHLGEWLGTDNDHTFKFIKASTDDLGIKHSVYQHFYKGTKVADEVILLHEKEGKITYVNGELSQKINLAISQPLPQTEVEAIVAADMNSPKITYADYEPVITKVIKERGGVELHATTQINALSTGQLKGFIYFIDNATKKIVKKLAKILHVDTPSTSTTLYKGNQQITVDSYNGSYRLKDNARNIQTLNGTDWDGNGDPSTGELTGAITDYTSATANFTDVETKPAVEVHWAMKNTYDYYVNRHNRNSYDGNGSIIRNYYNINFNTPNTPIDGSNAAALDVQGIVAMVYGNGMYNGSTAYFNPIVGLDVAGHEFSHLVIGRNGLGGLNYQSESGALNESIADMLGTAIEFYSGINANWTVGEGIPKFAQFMRSMSNPNSGPAALGSQQPDTYLGTYWKSTASPTQQNDWGGVHTNSGVGNYWFYLLSMGGSGTNDIGNAFNVTGITIQKAEKIIYRALTNYMTPNTTYLEAYNATRQAVTDLYGASGNEQQQNVNAWYAVGIGDGLLGAKEFVQSENQFNIYPNPVKNGAFTIENNENNATFEIYDVSGKLVKRAEKLNKGTNKININSIQKGVYLLKISSNGTAVSKKIVVE